MPGFLPDSDSEDELPPGWEEKATLDGHVFYTNHQNKSTQWVHPRTGKSKRVSGELPIGWKRIIDDKTERPAFLHTTTNQVTYTDPRLAFATEEPSLDIAGVRQRFDSSSTALQILHGKDLSGKLAVITGSNCGIGFETARSLALHGCEIIFACRNKNAAEEAIEKIATEKPAAGRKCRFMCAPLVPLRSLKEFVDNLKESVKHIDFLILNAGVFSHPYHITEDGLEATFQICHLSHFYLTLELDELLDHTSRVIVLSSESHRFANLPSDELTRHHVTPPPSKYSPMMAYNNAKLCNVLFTMHLAEKWKRRGISVFAVHPGNMISTNISRHWWFYRLLFAIVRPFTKSLQQGAATSVYCATASELTGLTGLYFNNCFFCEPSKLAQNKSLADKLWTLSEEIVKEVKSSNYYIQSVGSN